MRARVTSTQMSPDKFAEVVAIYCESTLPAARQAPGNQGVLLLTDKNTGKGIAVSIWETEADLLASESESGYYQEQLVKYEPFFTVPPVRESYEVVLRE
jgi:hypothetical protein